LNIFFRYTFLLSAIIVVGLLSCKKEFSCEHCDTGNVITPPASNNQPPVAIAFYDSLNNQPPGSEFVSAKFSTDADGTIVSYQWRQVAGPATCSIAEPTNFETVISSQVQGVYQIELTVTDNGGQSGKDTVAIPITVGASSALVTANAGPDQTITLPLDSTYLDGSGSTPDGFTTPASTFIWNCIRGPRQYVLNLFNLTPALNLTTVSANGLVPGVYLYELRVTTPAGASDVDTVQITVINDPQLRNTVTYHDLEWTEGDIYGLGLLSTFISSSIKPDIFTQSGGIKPIEISLKASSSTPFTVVPFNSNSPFTWDAFPYSAWIMTIPNNPSLVGKRADLRVRFL
jgi:hypothetical protein